MSVCFLAPARPAARRARVRRGVGGAASGAAGAGGLRGAVRPDPASRSRPSGTGSASIARSREQYAQLAEAHADAGSRRLLPVPTSRCADLVARAGAPTPPCSRSRALLLRDADGHSVRHLDRQPRRTGACPVLRGASLVLLSVPPLISSLVLLTIAARDGMAAGLRHGRRASHLRRPDARARAAGRGDARAAAVAVDRRRARRPSATAARARGIPATRDRVAPWLAPVAWPGAGDLRRDRRIALQRIVRRGDRDVVAGPRRR